MSVNLGHLDFVKLIIPSLELNCLKKQRNLEKLT